MPRPARNIIICCDGTDCQFGTQNTSIIRLVQSIDHDLTKQLLYYDPGLGTMPEQRLITTVGKWTSQTLQKAFGVNMLHKVMEAYAFLMDCWEPGDKVYLFGFSRGAYTVRVLAAILHSMGLLSHGNSSMLPYIIRLFKSIKNSAPGSKNSELYWKLLNNFRWTFSRQVNGDSESDRRFPIHFLGCWDTVSSVGWIWNPVTYPSTSRNPSIAHIRHAVSIDEKRSFYNANLMVKDEANQTFLQPWFPGVHSDIGGGYKESLGSLWQEPFFWMIKEAMACGLLINPERLDIILGKNMRPAEAWREPTHESLRQWWWLAEYVPKKIFDYQTKTYRYTCGCGNTRYIPPGSLIHRSALNRIKAMGYKPRNINNGFRGKVKKTVAMPEYMEYL